MPAVSASPRTRGSHRARPSSTNQPRKRADRTSVAVSATMLRRIDAYARKLGFPTRFAAVNHLIAEALDNAALGLDSAQDAPIDHLPVPIVRPVTLARSS